MKTDGRTIERTLVISYNTFYSNWSIQNITNSKKYKSHVRNVSYVTLQKRLFLYAPVELPSKTCMQWKDMEICFNVHTIYHFNPHIKFETSFLLNFLYIYNGTYLGNAIFLLFCSNFDCKTKVSSANQVNLKRGRCYIYFYPQKNSYKIYHRFGNEGNIHVGNILIYNCVNFTMFYDTIVANLLLYITT